VAAVAGIDYGHCGVIGHQLRGAFPGVAQDDNIGVAADNPCHVRDAFALAKDVDFGSATLMTLPPRRCIADSKESRVRCSARRKWLPSLCRRTVRTVPAFFGHFVRKENIDSISLLVQVVNGD